MVDRNWHKSVEGWREHLQKTQQTTIGFITLYTINVELCSLILGVLVHCKFS